MCGASHWLELKWIQLPEEKVFLPNQGEIKSLSISILALSPHLAHAVRVSLWRLFSLCPLQSQEDSQYSMFLPASSSEQ